MSLKAHYYYVIVLYRAKPMTCVLATFWVQLLGNTHVVKKD